MISLIPLMDLIDLVHLVNLIGFVKLWLSEKVTTKEAIVSKNERRTTGAKGSYFLQKSLASLQQVPCKSPTSLQQID